MNGLELKVEKKMDEEEVKELVGDKVTEEKIEESLNYDLLSEEEKKAVDDFNSKIDINDATEILQFGAPAQDKISKFSDSILEDVKTKDTGEVPMHIRNAPIKQMESLGYHQGYLYPHDFPNHYVEQQYLPDKMLGTKYYNKDF